MMTSYPSTSCVLIPPESTKICKWFGFDTISTFLFCFPGLNAFGVCVRQLVLPKRLTGNQSVLFCRFLALFINAFYLLSCLRKLCAKQHKRFQFYSCVFFRDCCHRLRYNNQKVSFFLLFLLAFYHRVILWQPICFNNENFIVSLWFAYVVVSCVPYLFRVMLPANVL